MRQRHRRHLAELGEIHQRVFITDRVFDEERLVLLDRLAGAQRVVQVEPLVKVDAPVAVRADALAHLLALLFHPAYGRSRVVHAADRHLGRRHAERAISGFHRGAGAFLQTQSGTGRRAGRSGATGRVALAVVTRAPAEQLVHRQPERLALDVPEREVQGAQGVGLLPPGRVEPRDVRLLPERLGPERVLTDQRPGALLQRVLGAALADPRDADVGLDRDDHVALVEQGIEVRRAVDPDARDLGLRQFRRRLPGPQQAHRRRRRNGVEKGSSVHEFLLRKVAIGAGHYGGMGEAAISGPYCRTGHGSPAARGRRGGATARSAPSAASRAAGSGRAACAALGNRYR